MRNIRFCIDRGGTFTDVYAECPDDNRQRVMKLLSVDTANYQDAPTEGIRRILEEFTGTPHPRGQPIDTSRIESIRMGTTVATNALLERKGEPFALLVTRGFPELLHIGNQSRPNIFDLQIKSFDLLYDRVLEVHERVVLCASVNASGREPRGEDLQVAHPGEDVRFGVTNEPVRVVQELDEAKLRAALTSIHDQGIRSIAVVLMHAAIFPDHELQVGRIAKEIGFTQISLSHQVMPMVKIVPRGFTACADAYLTPHVVRYLQTFMSGFDDGLTNGQVQLSFMQSDGGLTPVDKFNGHRAILSGPAGGVVGYALTSDCVNWGRRLSSDGASDSGGDVSSTTSNRPPVIGFDMGGTSTDVSRYDGSGQFEHVHESTTAGVTIQAPQLDIVTVAAGGGSRLFFQNGLFVVGPESAGAHPGPVCYRKGGYLAITDANLMLGRIIPSLFPCIFGPTEDQPLDAEATRNAFVELTKNVNAFATRNHQSGDAPMKTVEEVAYGFIQVANEAMCRPIRELTQMKGYDITKHVLACFGGAGGQHACAIARNLAMKHILVHRYSGILSAYGMGLAELVEERQEPSALVLDASASQQVIESTHERLGADARSALEQQGIPDSKIVLVRYLNLRYQGTDCAIMVPHSPQGGFAGYRSTFEDQYEREFGFKFPDRKILVDDIRVRAQGKSSISMDTSSGTKERKLVSSPDPFSMEQVYFADGWAATPLFKLGALRDTCVKNRVARWDESVDVCAVVPGPAVLLDATSTVLVEPNCLAVVNDRGDVLIEVDVKVDTGSFQLRADGSDVLCDELVHLNVENRIGTDLDPIQLSIFSHRFMGIAEQMGRTLQRTSVSVNIKERLDFSCALFGPDGGLIANAPHIPVHLGAMQEAVKCQMRYWLGEDNREGLQDGDVLVSNHPQLAGGSHLPDITVITPVFAGGEIVFWVASRGHHADIGGIAPGSMPPLSKCLEDEGAAIVAFKLVKQGHFREKEISELLLTPPGSSPESKGTRNLSDNLSDLRAQVAANTKGIHLVQDLIAQYTLPVVHAYMNHIMNNAEFAVREMLTRFAKLQDPAEKEQVVVEARDSMDDGSPIVLQVSIDPNTGDSVFDFTGTGPEVLGNLNAPPAVTYSAVIYALRCLVDQEIPLNQGCLKPVRFVIPENSLLHPSPEASVVGGNVLTSQRVVDVVLKSFKACAASQGCMNNLTFGDEAFGYYETIAGGAGAGPTWHGRSGVHTHMTNTRITDPEVLERRYPVILHEFRLRHGSGGTGLYSGGDGVIREMEFLRPLTLSILSERRVLQPYGMAGGGPGDQGVNLFLQKPKNKESPYLVKNLGGRNTVSIQPGDRIRLLTPGGGAYGLASE